MTEEFGTFCWSPDGTQIAVSGEKGFKLVDKLSGNSKEVPLNGIGPISPADWSPASNLLLFEIALENNRCAIWTVRPDGSRQRKVIEMESSADFPHWSADGDAIYFLRPTKGNTYDLAKIAIDPKSGEANGQTAVVLSGLQRSGDFSLSADATRLAYQRSESFSNLWLAEFSGSGKDKKLQTRPLTKGTAHFSGPAISPDGKWIAFTNTLANRQIYKMPIEGGTPIQLTFSDADHFSPAWSADGKRIAFISDEGGSAKIWIVDAGSGKSRQLAKTQPDPMGSFTIWSPGARILYGRGPGVFGANTILDPETEEEKPLFPDATGSVRAFPKFSPDGKRVAVMRPKQSGLWVISLASKFRGQATQPRN